MKIKKYPYGRLEVTLFSYTRKIHWQQVKRSWWSGFAWAIPTKGRFTYYLEFLTFKRWPQAFIISKRDNNLETEKTFAFYLFNSN